MIWQKNGDKEMVVSGFESIKIEGNMDDISIMQTQNDKD